MAKAKLPPYKELKRLVLEDGLSYATIATKYKAHHDSVYQALKYGANKNKEPWPFVQDRTSKISRGLEKCTMPADGLAFVLDEDFRKARESVRITDPLEMVDVPCTALDKCAPRTALYWGVKRDGKVGISSHRETWPKRNAAFHRPGCHAVRGIECVSMEAQEADQWAFVKCSLCFDLSTAQWCVEHGWSNSYIRGILDGSFARIRIVNAQKIMKELGEPMPSHLKNWKPQSHAWEKRKWERRRKAA